MVDWYVPEHVPQMDGSPCQVANCWAAAGSWLAAAATGGTVRISPTDFRKRAGGGSGNKGPSGCASGFEEDVAAGLRALGIQCSLLKLPIADARRLIEKDRRGVYSIAVDYEVFGPGVKCQDSFEGNHMLGIIGGRPTRSMDPLCPDYKPLGVTVLLDAAGKFSRDHHRGLTIWLVKVQRPIPQGLPADQKLIEIQRARIEALEDGISSAIEGLRDVEGALVETLRLVDTLGDER